MSNIFHAARRISRENQQETYPDTNGEGVAILLGFFFLVLWIGGKISKWLNKY